MVSLISMTLWGGAGAISCPRVKRLEKERSTMRETHIDWKRESDYGKAEMKIEGSVHVHGHVHSHMTGVSVKLATIS